MFGFYLHRSVCLRHHFRKRFRVNIIYALECKSHNVYGPHGGLVAGRRRIIIVHSLNDEQ